MARQYNGRRRCLKMIFEIMRGSATFFAFHGTKKFAEKNQEMKPNPLFRGITYENAPNDE